MWERETFSTKATLTRTREYHRENQQQTHKHRSVHIEMRSSARKPGSKISEIIPTGLVQVFFLLLSISSTRRIQEKTRLWDSKAIRYLCNSYQWVCTLQETGCDVSGENECYDHMVLEELWDCHMQIVNTTSTWSGTIRPIGSRNCNS